MRRGILPVSMTVPAPSPAAAPTPPTDSRRSPRLLLWVALVVLLVVAQSLLVVLTLRFEQARAQERTDDLASSAQGEIRRRAQLVLQGVQGLQTHGLGARPWAAHADGLLRSQREIGRASCRERVCYVV